ncbi:hypothetical protein TanjilG_14930 [Lupinus angustifolius]|uniref:methionine S-methyltransferase n=1 Tax=Lupinus angustifolius TaxID=3871 RepID=A0A1J7G6W3_LUPAN|nr:hypothetical protein TanjilG_14930 [Lupinus angustifolius]
MKNVDEFLQQCQHSGDAAYAAIRSVLERLDDPNTRSETRIFLSNIQKRFQTKEDCDKCFDTYHFKIEDIMLEEHPEPVDKRRSKLTMMVIPSIFLPEDWSFTFYEGINRHNDSIFKDRTLAELGCGNGWISIALADKWLPSKVYGLDINPRAIKVSWINLYLNALDHNGNPIYDEENKTLLDRVEFHESDLLSYCRLNHIQLDRIVGCIPQILNPNPDAMTKLITENASEDFLHSLSNYCALQGFVEDQFGLGLIARAVEEGISAGDTDIAALVEIEKNSPHRFEFFMGLSGDQSICARTAWAYGKAGGSISHALSVYSCQLRQPNQVKAIFEFLKDGFQEVSSSLDLFFEDDSVADEKIPFLAYLASILKNNSIFPYEPPAGSKRFRNLIAGFLKTYHHIPLTADGNPTHEASTKWGMRKVDVHNLTTTSGRDWDLHVLKASAIENALRLFSPRLAVVDEHLTQHLPRQWLTSLILENTRTIDPLDDTITVIEAPRQSDLMIELIKKLKPEVVVTGITHFEAVTSSAFVHLLDTTREIGSRLFLDISDHFELSSLPRSNGVLKYLSGTPLPSHAAIICGLVKNKVYPDLEVAFVVSEEETLFSALSKTVELLEGNTALISQYYYGCIFHELLAFQLAGRRAPAERNCENVKSVDMIGFAKSALSVLNDAELSIDGEENGSLIHMDVDQIFLPVPSPVKAAIFESFARQNMSESETDVTTSIKEFVKSNYGFPTGGSTEFIYANNSKALFNKMVLCCIKEGGTFCFPAGSNGNYVSSAKFLKADTMTVPTDANVGFKFTEKTLTGVLGTVKNPWVYISGPTVSPTGLVYSNNEIEEILSTCARFGARVIIDTSSSGLEFDCDGWGGWDLEGCLSKLNTSCKPSFCVSLLGGLSLKMLNGVFRFGFLILNQPILVDTFYSYSGLSKPHGTVRYAIKKLLELREQKPSKLLDAIVEHTRVLRSRSKCFKEALEKNGWDVVESCAGVSIVAKPSAYLNKAVKVNMGNDTIEITLDDSNIRNAILKATGLCINSGSWTGIPGYCRFNIALEENDFKKALDCIAKFKEVVLN